MILSIQFPSWLRPTVVPGLPFRWYGLLYLAGFALTFALFLTEIRRRDPSIDRESAADFMFWLLLGTLVGARLHYVIASGNPEYARSPWLIFWPFRDGSFVGIQGLGYDGGLMGAIVAVVVYGRIRRVSVLDWGDAVAVSAPLGYALSRLGTFTNEELIGRATAVPWGVVFPNARRYSSTETWVRNLASRVGIEIQETGQMVNLPRHPTQLYDLFLGGIVLWLTLWFVARKAAFFRGAMICLYLAGHGAARFMTGFFGTTAAPGPGEQIASLLMIAAGLAFGVLLRVFHRPASVIETFEESD